MVTVIKLGGSVITEKDQPETVDTAALDRTAEAVAAAQTDLVIVHGAGSFGHHHADKHGVSTTDGTDDAAATVAIHDSMKRLNDDVLTALQNRDVPAVPVHPLSVGARDTAGNLSLPMESVVTMLADGFVPVLHGDVISHAGRGTTIISGDELVAELARQLDADRVGLCSTVPGVLDEDGNVIDRIEAFEDVADVLGGSDTTDVTGGMAEKVRVLLELSVPASIFGRDDLAAFLDGNSPGTLIDRAVSTSDTN